MSLEQQLRKIPRRSVIATLDRFGMQTVGRISNLDRNYLHLKVYHPDRRSCDIEIIKVADIRRVKILSKGSEAALVANYFKIQPTLKRKAWSDVWDKRDNDQDDED